MSLNGTQKADFYEGTVALEIMAEGISTFIQQHKCDYICTGMGLLPLIATENDSVSDNGEEL